MVRLIPYADEYAPLIMKWREDPRMAEFFRRAPHSMDLCSLASIRAHFGTHYFVAEEDKVCGLVTITNHDYYAKTVEWGILLDPDLCSYQKEVSRQAHHIVMDYIFNYIQMNKAYAKIMAHRSGALDRLKLLGFYQEAVLKEHFNGQDELLVACLRREYKEHSEPFVPEQKLRGVANE
jgi:RimJ/RimL family protein N-acetyltransferase